MKFDISILSFLVSYCLYYIDMFIQIYLQEDNIGHHIISMIYLSDSDLYSIFLDFKNLILNNYTL